MTSSIRNAPLDIATTRILNYLRTHNYDDCAVYINRLSSNTFRKILSSDLSIDTLLAQLPFSIEIFEVMYSKTFIIDPDTFPLRVLKPERLISRMISIFALSNVAKSPSSSTLLALKPHEQAIEDERLLSNLASILRIVSYVQPILFKRLLRQKETIDQCILHFEQHHSIVITTSTLKKSSSLTHINLEDTLRHELESTIVCCQQALQKLESKPAGSSKLIALPSSTHSTPVTPKKHHGMHKSISAVSSITSMTINSLDDVQNRLFQHKAILNLIEPYLSRTKLYTVLDNLGYKVSMDKQILLAYAHIKAHEKQLPLAEPLLPLFKRFAFAYERRFTRLADPRCTLHLGIIQLWRRVTDSALIDECIDDIVIDNTSSQGLSSTVGICFERTRSCK